MSAGCGHTGFEAGQFVDFLRQFVLSVCLPAVLYQSRKDSTSHIKNTWLQITAFLNEEL